MLITGASGHLGRIASETFAEIGYDLILTDLKATGLVGLAAGIRRKWGSQVLCLPCNLGRETERLRLIRRIKADGHGLACLLNNAALVGSSGAGGWAVPFARQSLKTWRQALEVNLTAPFHLSQALAEELGRARGGTIINIASIYGEVGPDWRLYEGTSMGNPAAYAASKGGLIQLTRYLATTLAPKIRVNAISPGGIFRGQEKTFTKKYCSRVPMKRMATEGDFRGALVYLASELSSYVTGQILNIDGGWTSW